MENKAHTTEIQAEQELNNVTTVHLPETIEETAGLQEEDYAGMNQHELVKTLDKLLTAGDMTTIGRQVKAIKEHYTELAKEEFNQKLSKYIEEGGEKADFSPTKGPNEQKFEELFKRYNKQKADHIATKEKTLAENLLKKQQLLAEVKRIADNASAAAQNFKRIQEIQASWKEIGYVPAAQADELWKNYKVNIDRYFDLLHLNNELRDLNFKRNLELKTELCEKAEKLADEPLLRKALETLRTLQEHWRETGFAGKEHNDTIYQRFKVAESKLDERKKVQQAEVLGKQEENLKAKTALCEELRTLNQHQRSNHKDWQAAHQQLDALWERWRKIGTAPDSDKDNCWKTFKQLRQEFYHLKDSFYVKLREEQDINLALKIALCEKAEALQTSTDWLKTASALKRLQEEWKTIGHAPKHKGDKAWNRFHTACDGFFNNRKQHFSALDMELEQNAIAKGTIIEQIKQLHLSNDANENIAQLRNLQQAWLESGKAPESSFKQLNKAYNNALDEKMQQIQQSSGIDNTAFSQMRYEHLLQSNEGRNELHKERATLADKVKKLKHDITTQENNLSFFGKSKGAAALLSEYTAKIEELKLTLKALEKELKTMPLV